MMPDPQRRKRVIFTSITVCSSDFANLKMKRIGLRDDAFVEQRTLAFVCALPVGEQQFFERGEVAVESRVGDGRREIRDEFGVRAAARVCSFRRIFDAVKIEVWQLADESVGPTLGG